MQAIDYSEIYVSSIQGRYVTYDHLNQFISSLSIKFKVVTIGESVRNESIKSITFGNGPKRILMWSQMHGNESTTTKAIVDLLNYLQLKKVDALEIGNACTLKIIPILNPDGARDYTRVNANKIDLNRDAHDLTQPESRILKKEYDAFDPHYCFNLHDQRTIFNVGKTDQPATVSFLAPAFDVARNNSPSRKLSMQLIAAMNSELQELIPGQVGRYDDGFNANCVGDAFQMRGTPTILFESGHYVGDYQREKTRELIFYSLLKGISTIVSNSIEEFTVEQYLSIPENGKQFVDILVCNDTTLNKDLGVKDMVPIQYKEVLKNGEIVFVPMKHVFDMTPVKIFGHKTLNLHDEEDLNWLKNNDIVKLLD
ncbi:M14 metallopeptidase family protein [uncultured Maribacter sp.]|uniref:M14 family metallopeptidase n=1 Tax=uncultured Maribacter sp. TaxID=431308 RepID=UPI0030EBE99A|tara:strand:+ start:21360 stop:22463 length:1104 start_codon:yes stop_codon:yes gene_type:complete